MTKPVITQNFDPIGQFKAGISSGPPWQSIVDFATHKSFCGKRLYPRQMTLLKLMYLETETMTDYDRDVIGTWAEGFKNFHAPIGVQPDIWDRVAYLKANGFTHFPHIQMVMGRRASKGILGGIVGAERIAYLYSLGSWQQHYNQVPGQVAEVVVVANSLTQAVTRQFRDIRNTVINCEYLRSHIVGDKQTEFYIRTPGDEQTIIENKLAGISSDREIATIYCKASSSVSTSGRGGTAIANFYDEMAHMMAGTGSAKTGEEIYDAFQPSLDQFGSAALTYSASSPYTKIGKFYDLYQQGRVTMDEYNEREGKLKTASFIEEAAAQDLDVEADDITAAVAEPTFLVVQLPSWETYRDWDRSRDILMRPNRTRCFPRWNSPVQFEPNEHGSPDEKVQYRRMRRNPDKFKVERGAQFATVQDAYLNEVMVDRMFAPPGWRPALEQQHSGRLSIAYRAHADPSRTNANFGFCIAHLEEAPPDEHGIAWPHVIIDVLKVWKPQDFSQHTIDYVQVGEELDDYLTRFPSMVKMSYDQFNCQSGETLISTGYGMLRLDEIVGAIPDRTGIPLELPVRSKDADAVAEQGYHKGVVPTRKIITKLGTSLNVTPEHRLWTRKGREKPWQRDGEWGYAEAKDIAVGDWLCVKRNTCMVSDEFDLTSVSGWAESRGVQRHARDWTPTCDESLAEALGLLVAEGDYRSGLGAGRDYVRFGNSDDEVLERYRMLMEKSFGGTWRSQVTDEWKGKYHYGWVRKAGVVPGFLGRLGLTGTATDKVIPWVIYRSPAPVIQSFLRGYFEGDGGVIFGREGEAWVSACSTSEEVAKGIQQLLMSVGVFCTLWSGNYRYKGKTRPQWRVLMYGQDALDFARLIGFSSTRKRQELADAVTMIEAKQTGNIRSKNQRHGDEYWVRITGIEESQADCYEISVPGPESYIANGMVSHNSAGFIAHQKRAFPNIRILEKTFTVKENQDRFEKFKSALNLGWVHSYRDTFAEEGQSLLELELKFLQEKNGRVDRQEIGPVQTKDLSDAVMVVTTELLHESLDRWWKAINRTSVGSTNVDGLRSGREQERLLFHETNKTHYTDPLQRYLADEAEKSERRTLRAERNRAALEKNKAERARRNAFGSRPAYTGDRTRGYRG